MATVTVGPVRSERATAHFAYYEAKVREAGDRIAADVRQQVEDGTYPGTPWSFSIDTLAWQAYCRNGELAVVKPPATSPRGQACPRCQETHPEWPRVVTEDR